MALEDQPTGMAQPSKPKRFERIEAQPAYMQVASTIEREIFSGRIGAGSEIGTEAELCQQLGVNRSTVREGIRQLERDGLVKRNQSRRLIVSMPNQAHLANRMGRAMVLYQVTFRELWETTLMIETTIAAAVAQKGPHLDLSPLYDTITTLEKSGGDIATVAKADADFHNVLAQLSGNRVSQLAREPCALLFFPTLTIILEQLPQGWLRIAEAHHLIADAIREGDVDKARLWMKKHNNDWKTGFEMAGRNLDDPIHRDSIS